MKTVIPATIATALLLAVCVDDPARAAEARTHTETRTLSAFDQVRVSRGVSVTLVCGQTAQARLEGESAVDLSDTVTSIEGSVLTVTRSSLLGNHHRPVHVAVTAPRAVDHVKVSSGGSIAVPSCAASPDHLDLEASSGGDVVLAGKTAHLTAQASSGGSIKPPHGERLDAGEARLSASSGGTIGLCNVSNLSGKASSGGTIDTESGGANNEIHSSSGGNIGIRTCP